MSFDYAKSAASALRMLERFGQSVIRKSYTAGTFNPATGTAAPTETTSLRTGVLLPFGKGLTTFNGTSIQAGDAQLLLDAEGPVAVTDRYVINTTEYTVVAFEALAPAGITVLNTIHLRQ